MAVAQPMIVNANMAGMQMGANPDLPTLALCEFDKCPYTALEKCNFS